MLAATYQYGAAIMVRPLWCGHYGEYNSVWDSMVLVFYGARHYGAMVRRIFLLFGIFGGPYKGRFLWVFLMLRIELVYLYKINVGNRSFHIVNDSFIVNDNEISPYCF